MDVMQVLGAHGIGGSRRKSVMVLEKVATYSNGPNFYNSKILFKNGYMYGAGVNTNEFSRLKLSDNTLITKAIAPLTDYHLDGNYIYVLSSGVAIYKYDMALNLIAQSAAFPAGEAMAQSTNYLYVLSTASKKIYKVRKSDLVTEATIALVDQYYPIAPLQYSIFVVSEELGLAALPANAGAFQVAVVRLSDGVGVAKFSQSASCAAIGFFFTKVDGITLLNVLVQDGSTYTSLLYRYRMDTYTAVVNGSALESRGSSGRMYYVQPMFPTNPNSNIYISADNGNPIVMYPGITDFTWSDTPASSGHQIASDGTQICVHQYFTTRHLYNIKWRG